MDSTWIKIGIAYIAGVVTFIAYEEVKDTSQTENMMTIQSDTMATDTLSILASCACDAERYNVPIPESSQNFPISNAAACSSMVNTSTQQIRTVEAAPKGAWFSKVTLDLMFCHAMDANGIYVYNGVDPDNQPTFIIEAANSKRILTTDNGTATMYYSKALCPNICGLCGQ